MIEMEKQVNIKYRFINSGKKIAEQKLKQIKLPHAQGRRDE